MNKLRHLAITSPDPPSLASTFVAVFGMTVLRDEGGAIYLTDGYLHFVITPTRDGGSGGINHVGFYVDDLDEIRERASSAALSAAPPAATGLAPDDVAPGVAFWRLADGWDVEARERGWAETIASHTDLYDLAPAPRPRTLQLRRDASDVELGPGGARVRVCPTADLPTGAAARVDIDGETVLVLNADGTVYAVQDRCTHHPAGRLSDGGRDGCVVECHTHLARFDVTTGEVVAGPARRALRTYEVEIVDGDVWLVFGESAVRALREPHVHRTPVTLADGTSVVAVSYLGADPYTRDDEPPFGLYLDERWNPPWPHAHLDWPDFGSPADVDAVRSAFTDLLERARAGDAVEVGCLGGHGRTGTALACLAVLTGTPADEAVEWVRRNYCEHAVETAEQASFVAAFSR